MLGPWLWFVVVAFVITAPLLGSGYLMLLDYPSGPVLPHVPLLPLPSSGAVGNETPLLAIEALFRHLAVWLPDKTFLVAPIVLGGVGVFRLVRSRFGVSSAAATYGATLYVVNPFVADRYLAGQVFFLLAIAFIPWALGPVLDLLDRADARTGVFIGMWLLGLAAIDLHVAGMYALLVVIAGTTGLSRRAVVGAVVGLPVGAVLCAYWLVPSLFAFAGSQIDTTDLATYASRPAGMGVLPALAGMYGFWRTEFSGPAQRVPALYILLVPIVGLSIAGASRVLESERSRRVGLVLVVAAIAGLLLAAGTAFPPTAAMFRWIFDHVPLFRIFREPQKFLVLLVLAYAVFGAVGLESLARNGTRFSSMRAWGASALAIGIVAAYAYTMLWGFWGQVHLTRYPSDWEVADQMMAARGPGRVLVLPWHLYAVWSFTEGRIVANPAPSFFARDVLAGDNVGFNRIPTQSVDPFSSLIGDILEHRAQIRELGHLVAPLDVRFVVLLDESDSERYGFIKQQTDLTPVYQGSSLELFENQAWQGSDLALQPATSAFDWHDVGPATERLIPMDARAPAAGTAFAPLGRILPESRLVQPVPAQYITTGDRCTDGWRLGEQEPVCDLGAVAAFPVPAQAETLWRPSAGARVLGSIVSALTLIGALLYVRLLSTGIDRRRAVP